MANIFAQLPNDLIMDIIQIADGGKPTHKKRFQGVIRTIKLLGKMWGESNVSGQRVWTLRLIPILTPHFREQNLVGEGQVVG